jgi:hypothetical protein
LFGAFPFFGAFNFVEASVGGATKFTKAAPPTLTSDSEFEKRSPFFAHLPNCENYDNKIVKKNPNLKGILCPMFRDEEGFLTEWIAFYQLMGFNHIMFFDDGSTDKSLEELQPELGFESAGAESWRVCRRQRRTR